MNRGQIHVSAAGLLLAAFLYYMSTTETLAAVLIPVAVHELGHLCALFLLGMQIRSFRFELKGLCIEYFGYTGAVGHALAAAAGPAAGLAYAAVASALGVRLESDWLFLSSGISLLLSLFNLLPALPLDGGRILYSLACAFLGDRRGAAMTDACGLVVGVALMSVGLWLLVHKQALAVEFAAVWLLLYQESGQRLVKMREII